MIEKERERETHVQTERERETHVQTERERDSEQAKGSRGNVSLRVTYADVKKFASDLREPKLKTDWSSEEKHYARSLRIRRAIARWMYRHVGKTFESSTDLENQAANYARCGWQTAHRWIVQFAAKNGVFKLALDEEEDSITIKLRG